jgi:hypothetical protein
MSMGDSKHVELAFDDDDAFFRFFFVRFVLRFAFGGVDLRKTGDPSVARHTGAAR